MEINRATPYQYKLDLGEGSQCHEAYEEYLLWGGYEDTNDRWVHFTEAWKRFECLQALMERQGQIIQ
jgi:hypothetical protein